MGGALNWQQEMAKLQREEDLFRRLFEQRDLRRHQYEDPAKHFEYPAELQRQAKAKESKRRHQRERKDHE